jgi:hypothetical protein
MQLTNKIFLVIIFYLILAIWFYFYKKVDIKLFDKAFKINIPINNSRFHISRINSFKNSDIRLKENSNDKLNEYVNLFNSNINVTKNATRKVIFCEPRGSGYGNRLYTFFSCFVVALLTDSLVILTGWHETRDFIDLPLNLFYETNASNELNPKFEKEKIHGFGVPYAWSAKKDLNSLMNFEIPKDRTRFHYGGYESLFMVLCTNPIHYDKLLYYNLVKNETVQKSIKTMNHPNSTYVEKNHDLFMIGFEVGANLMNKIIMPKPRIQEFINDFLRRDFVDNYVIGIQLRTLYLDVEKDSLRFLNCAFQIENEYLRWSKSEPKPVKWYISSDSEDLLKKIVALYPDKTLAGNGSILHVADHSHGYYRTLIDVDLLSRCDELIHTGGSTFGFVSAMKSFKVPYFVDGKSKSMKCSRTTLGTSSQLPTGEGVF